MSTRSQRFLEALSTADNFRPHPLSDGGFVALGEPDVGTTIDGWWTHDQIDFALDAAFAAPRTSIDDAMEIVTEIERCQKVQREIKAAFVGAALDGGAVAAFSHPLYMRATERISELRAELMLVI